MLETTSQQTGIIDPSLTAGNVPYSPELTIKYNTFEEARAGGREFTDSFIDGCIEDSLKVGEEEVGIRGYLDKVETTEKDESIIKDPEAIAALYLTTSEMVARNLKLAAKKNISDERRATLKEALASYKERLHTEAIDGADEIVDYCEGNRDKSPRRAMGYHGFKVDGVDVLDASEKSDLDFRPNIKIQRQAGGTFIMAYSDKRVVEKLEKKDERPTKRIYLNPDPSSSPQIFEQVLQAANEAGLSIQLKMWQRSQEYAWTSRTRSEGKVSDALRGDGIVIYVNDVEADDVLGMVLALAKDRPEAFVGRQTSRIPESVADGIAIGDEPSQVKGESLTSHRVQMLDYAAEYVRKSGKTGQEAKRLFRNRLAAVAKANKIDPRNIAFNSDEVREGSSVTAKGNTDESESIIDVTGEPEAGSVEEHKVGQETKVDQDTANNIFESQVQQFVRSLHSRAESGSRELNQEEVQQIRSLVQVVQQRRGAAQPESTESANLNFDDKKSGDEDILKYMRDNNLDINTVSQRYESEVGQFVQGLRQQATKEGRELNPDEVRRIRLAVETVNNLRSFVDRAA